MIERVDEAIRKTLGELSLLRSDERQAYALQLHALAELRAVFMGQPLLPPDRTVANPWELR